MAQPHWTDSVIKQATGDLNRAKAAMQKAMLRPVLRQPNTSVQMQQFAVAPESYPVDARSRLYGMLKNRYGEQARNVAEYLGMTEEQ